MAEFDPSILPPRPQLIPEELRSAVVDNRLADWSKRLPPQAVGMLVATVTRWLSDPRVGARVQVDTQDNGWTIRVELPAPETREDLTLPE